MQICKYMQNKIFGMNFFSIGTSITTLLYYLNMRGVALLIPLFWLLGCSSPGGDKAITSPWDSPAQAGNGSDTDKLTIQTALEKLAIDDSYFPYAGLPRLSIVTLTLEDPEDTETEIPSYAIVFGKDSATTDTLELTLKCRGNTTFAMPKRSFKIEFKEKVPMFGMPANRDWALLANYGDKTLIKNKVAFKLSEWFGMQYTPRSTFVELYLNGSFRGLYQFTETVKVAKKRVNIPENENSFLVEIDKKYRKGETVVFNERETPFRIRFPKDASPQAQERLRLHLDSLERYLEYVHQDYTLALDSTPDHWFDVGEFVRHYWIQEFAKNNDAIPLTSVFFTWQTDGNIRMGPVWDFDAAFGTPEENEDPEGWYIREYSWYRRMLKMQSVADSAVAFWNSKRSLVEALPDSIDAFVKEIEKAADNNFKAWPELLESTNDYLHTKPYESYAEAVEDLKEWVRERAEWIDANLVTYK